MLRFSNCKFSYKKTDKAYLMQQVAKQLNCKTEDFLSFIIDKKSFDARKKPDVKIVYSFLFEVHSEDAFLAKRKKIKQLSKAGKQPNLYEQIHELQNKQKIIVVGAGPAGLFCAYYLALCGLKPIIIERGEPIEDRTKTVTSFWEQGMLNEESNVSFGEGGAGTFSDGKLNTGVKDKTGRKQFVLNSFVSFGANENICYDSKPHIGTDVLRTVIVNMRKEMERLGCQFMFRTKMIDFMSDKNKISSVIVEQTNGQQSEILCDGIVLALGHSARDTFLMLKEKNIAMEQKAFAMGVRVQHKQSDIDQAQYGIQSELLPPSPYKCTGEAKDGRGVYSFCMCPGGYVVNASSEHGKTVVNGMSNQKRDSGFANSAIIVTVDQNDFGSEDVLAGIEFQRAVEKAMYDLANGEIPVQTYGNFKGTISTNSIMDIDPYVKGKWQLAEVDKSLPKFMKSAIIDGIEQFGNQIQGFNADNTLIMGVESRTSSPVRILRDDEFESVSTKGLYPCGEGAGYAGGIMSAAMDGLRVAMKIQSKLEDGNN